MTNIYNLGFTVLLSLFLACSNSNEIDVAVSVDLEEIPLENLATKEEMQITEDGWQLVFDEAFDSNLDQWNVWLGGAFNNEIQLYNREQMTVANGILTIKAEKKPVNGVSNPFNSKNKAFEYVSGRIETKNVFGPSNKEGEKEYRILSRIKLAEGNGMWPAFWTYTNPWPTLGEIDIVESSGKQTTKFHSHIFHGTEVNAPLTKNEDTSKTHELNIDLTSGFHTYELIWKAESLGILFDGQLIHTYKSDSKKYVEYLFGNKHQIVLNLAVGGGVFEGLSSDSFVDSAYMQVDWVKVYKR